MSVAIVTLCSEPTNKQLPSAHSYYTFQLFCYPENFFWAEQGFLIQVQHLSRGRDVQFVTGSREHFIRVCSEKHTLDDTDADEVLQVQLQTIKRMLSGPAKPPTIPLILEQRKK